MKPLLIIWLGGGLGSIFRYGMQVGISRLSAISFPFGTFAVNLIGCFAIGLLYGLSERYTWLTLEWRLFLITGLCGGFTTFSSYSYESVSLFRQGNYGYFAVYVLLSIILGLLATVAGIFITK